jgi:integrase
MARIYKKKNKKGISWGYRVYVGTDPLTGKDIRKSKEGFLTQKDARLAAALFERQIHNREYIQPSGMLFADLCKDWEKHYSKDAKESSVRARRIALKKVTEVLGNIPLQKITTKAYQDIIDSLSTQYSYNYISSIHSTVSMVFTYAASMKMIKEVPTEGIKLPKKRIKVSDLEKNSSLSDKFLEKEELEEFLSVTKTQGLEGDLLAFTMLAYTGLRIGEMIALKWEDIDFTNHTLRVFLII